MKYRNAKLWHNFIKINNEIAKCRLCFQNVKTSGNTTNLKYHLLRKHKNLSKTEPTQDRCTNNQENSESVDSIETSSNPSTSELSPTQITSVVLDDGSNETPSVPSTSKSDHAESSKCTEGSVYYQPLISESFSDVTSFSRGGVKANKIANAIIFMIAKDSLPLDTTEKEGFQYLMKVLAPLYKLPGRHAVTNLVDEKYLALYENAKAGLKKRDFLCLTTDIWTETTNTKSFLGLTAHYIGSEETKLETLEIAVVPLSDRHTAEYISDQLQVTLNNWGISTEKITAIITDNAANITKAISILFNKQKSLPCFAHTLNLVATNTILDSIIKPVVEKVKNIVTYFKESVVCADELRKAQVDKNVPVLKLKQSVKTRWNSTFLMLQRFLQLKVFVAAVLTAHPRGPPMLTGTELQIVEEIITILAPLEAITKEISTEKHVTSSKIIPMVNLLITDISAHEPETEIGQRLKENVLNEIDKRFGAIEQNKLLAVATILDPRFKKIHFTNHLACSQTIRLINEELNQMIGAEDDVHNDNNCESDMTDNVTSPTGIWSHRKTLLEQYIKQVGDNNNSTFNEELRTYLSQPPIKDIKSNPLQYWAEHKVAFKRLAVVAKKYLTIPATSVPAERLFSKAGYIMTSRNRLMDKRLSKLLFLKSLSFKDWHLSTIYE